METAASYEARFAPWSYPALEKDAPVSRPVELPSLGQVIEIPKVGGLHHLYSRKAA